MTRLHACWTLPRPLPAEGERVLSFLPPSDEAALVRAGARDAVFARETSAAVRAEARAVYLAVCAELASTPDASGRTLRSECGSPSAWWWHPTSFKDPEADPAFGLIVAALTVRRAAEGREVVLHGAPEALARVLCGGPALPAPRAAFVVARALAARVRTMWRALGEVGEARRVPSPRVPAGGVALLGFWDWSPTPDGRGGLGDRYYKGLPAQLAARGAKPFWLCWLDPNGDPARRGRPAGEVREGLLGRDDVVLLQGRLAPGDVLAAALDFGPWRAFARRRGDPAFRSVFRKAGLDLYPLFEERLVRGFLDGCLPRCELVRRAARRAVADLGPAAIVTFLEHNPFARALYAGAREAARPPLLAAVQHAGLCAEKTFYFLDPAREFRGEPDGAAVPVPDLFLAMGEASREHILTCGYPPERVPLTGNPRYDALRPAEVPGRSGGGVRVLCVAALDTEVEIDMVEAAATAAEGLPGVEVAVRDHPFSRVADHPRFAAFSGRVRTTGGSLAEDLAWADAVVFTYSTVGEEAALQGKTVWQWRPLGYDASALAETAPIPRFGTVAALRAALAAFRPAALRLEERRRVEARLFHRLDGGAAARVADAVTTGMKRRAEW